MKVVIGSDHYGYPLKESIKEHLQEIGVEYDDYGVDNTDPVKYPEIAHKVAKSISDGEYERGILICGTGLGMAITANKLPGVRAATCHDIYSAERARKSNNAQVITFGAQVIGGTLANKLIDIWVESDFTGGRSKPKVALMEEIDEKYRK